MAANPHPTRIDGTTVTVTFTADEAERAHTAARYLLHTPLDVYPHPWDEIASFGAKEIDDWLAGLVELTSRYRGLLEQFEQAGVRDWSLERQLAHRAAIDRTGDRWATADPLPPASTGPVTITAEAGLLEELADELLGHKPTTDHDEYPLDNRAGEVIREQL